MNKYANVKNIFVLLCLSLIAIVAILSGKDTENT